MTIRHINIWSKGLTNRSNRLVRNQEKFLTLMDNYGTAMDYAKTATESAGTAIDKYNNSYMKSLEASRDRFESQFNQLSQTVFDSEFIKGTVDTGSGFLGVLTLMIKHLGSIPTLAMVAAGAISAITNKGKLIVHMPFATNGNIGRVKCENGVFNKGLQKQILQNGLYRRILSSTDNNVDGKALSA